MKYASFCQPIMIAAICVGAVTLLSGCSSGRSDAPFETIKAPDTKQELKSLPRGLLPDTSHVVHTGQAPSP